MMARSSSIQRERVLRTVAGVGIAVLLMCPAQSPGTEQERKTEPLSPEDVAKQRPKEEVTVRFRVESTRIELGGVLPKNSPPYKPIHLVPKVDLPNKKDTFYVILAGKALAHIHQLIENPGKHFDGSIVEAAGDVRYVKLPKITRRGVVEIPEDNYTHYEILITDLDHFRVVHGDRE